MEFVFFLPQKVITYTFADYFSFYALFCEILHIFNHTLAPFLTVHDNEIKSKPLEIGSHSLFQLHVSECGYKYVTKRRTDCATSRPITVADRQQVTLHFNYEKVRPGFVRQRCASCE